MHKSYLDRTLEMFSDLREPAVNVDIENRIMRKSDNGSDGPSLPGR